ncbi:DUF4190 domain-containing protein [Nocardia sp. ET3-3]|uniref:DUF4190 domain-containing protein n=2 Tax=Nocardia terrae TaxID=2675851 RepID=A0A7K1V0Z0_9NOCA|nr:DUF4190 domain-containing protein [Nocardia terrae]
MYPAPQFNPAPYGAPPQGYSPMPGPMFMVQQPRTNGMATASMVLGILSFITCGITALVAIPLGHVARGQIQRTGEGGGGQAVAGLILGYLTVAGWALFWILDLGLLAAAGSGGSHHYR